MPRPATETERERERERGWSCDWETTPTSILLDLTGHVEEGVSQLVDATPTFTADDHTLHDLGKPLPLSLCCSIHSSCMWRTTISKDCLAACGEQHVSKDTQLYVENNNK